MGSPVDSARFARARRVSIALLALGLGVVVGRAATGSGIAAETAPPASPPLTARPVQVATAAPIDAGTVAVTDASAPDAGTEPSGPAPAVLDPTLPTRGIPGAAASGDLPALRLAIEQGRDMGPRDTAGRTPLAIAAQAGQVPVLELLSAHGEALELATHDGRTPLILAAHGGQTAAVGWLLDHGARVQARDRLGHTALIRAAMQGHASTARLLLESGAKLDKRCERGLTALMHAVGSLQDDVALALIAYGPALEHRNRAGSTVLSLAADRAMVDVVRALLQAGAHVDSVSYGGLTPLALALSRRGGLGRTERRRYAEVADALVEAGADPALLRPPAVASLVHRGRFNALATRLGIRPLPKRRAALPDHIRRTKTGASTRVMALKTRSRSRYREWRRDRRIEMKNRGDWHTAQVFRQTRIRGLRARPDQRILLAGEVNGAWGLTVDDALLLEVRGRGGRVADGIFVGGLEELKVSGWRVPRLRRRSYQQPEIDITHYFPSGVTVVLSAIDWGYAMMSSDVFLRVVGPGAVETLSAAEIEVVR